MRTIAHCLAVIALAGGLVGCGPAIQPPPPQTKYLLQIAPESQAKLESVCFRMRPVAVRSPFSGAGLVYRSSPVAYERDHYNQFLTPPDQQIGEALSEWLAKVLCAEPVGLEDTQRRTLEPHLEALYGDFHDPDAPRAYARLRFVISAYDPSCRCSRILLNESFEATAALEPKPSAEEVVQAMSQAVNAALDQFYTSLEELFL